MKLPSRFVRFLAFTLALLPLGPAFAAEAKKKVLVVTVTTGFRHASIPIAEKILQQLANDSGKFTLDFIHQPEGEPKAPAKLKADADEAAKKKFEADDRAYQAARAEWMTKVVAALQKLSPANLKNYDAVLFASTTGDDLPLPDKQGFIDWIAAGHGFIGIHAATDTLKTSPNYVHMIGGAFKTHGPQVTVECLNQDPAHAACKPLPGKWTVFDEIYQMKDFSRTNVHGLLSLEKLALKGNENGETPGDYPVAWSRMEGKGRVFYTSLGHREDVWDPTYTDKAGRKNSPEIAKQFQAHVLGGILWALGLAEGSAKP